MLQWVPATFEVSLMVVECFAPGFISTMFQVALLPLMVAPGAATMEVSVAARAFTTTLRSVVSPGLETTIS